MKYQQLVSLAEKFEAAANPNIVVQEHPGVSPVSYMAKSNLENIISESSEILDLLNSQDDLPQWVDEMLAIAKSNISKVLDFIRSEKTAQSDLDLIKLASGKYDHIDFTPPKSVADAAARGLELRKKNKGRGGLSTQQANQAGVGSGVARAVSLKNRDTLSPATVRRMKAFFSRHQGSRKIDSGKSPGEDKGYIAWMLWGGDPGRSWAEKVVRQMDAADKKST